MIHITHQILIKHFYIFFIVFIIFDNYIILIVKNNIKAYFDCY